jgi:hypothetical protein
MNLSCIVFFFLRFIYFSVFGLFIYLVIYWFCVGYLFVLYRVPFCLSLHVASRDLERKFAAPDPWLAALVANRSATAVGAAAVVVRAGRHFAASSVSTPLGPGALGRGVPGSPYVFYFFVVLFLTIFQEFFFLCMYMFSLLEN